MASACVHSRIHNQVAQKGGSSLPTAEEEETRGWGWGGGAKKVEEGCLGGGDCTIIQITAGNNLVADVSRPTMPTAHRRACVSTCTPTPVSIPGQGAQNGEKINKSL